MTSDLARMIARVECVLLDFDGPVCRIFAGLPAPVVAAELRNMARQMGTDPPPEVEDQDDPLAIVKWAGTAPGDVGWMIEAALRATEVRAAASAEPTPGADAFLLACERTGRSVAIVSNNSADAVAAYLSRHGLERYITHIEGREAGEPALMKPDPYLVRRALEITGADPAAAVLVGDSVTDIEAAHAAGIKAIGYANKPGKAQRFVEAGADGIVQAMHDLAVAMTQRDPYALR